MFINFIFCSFYSIGNLKQTRKPRTFHRKSTLLLSVILIVYFYKFMGRVGGRLVVIGIARAQQTFLDRVSQKTRSWSSVSATSLHVSSASVSACHIHHVSSYTTSNGSARIGKIKIRELCLTIKKRVVRSKTVSLLCVVRPPLFFLVT